MVFESFEKPAFALSASEGIFFIPLKLARIQHKGDRQFTDRLFCSHSYPPLFCVET